MTKSLRAAFDLLKLDKINVVYPGEVPFSLAPGIEAVPLKAVA